MEHYNNNNNNIREIILPGKTDSSIRLIINKYCVLNDGTPDIRKISFECPMGFEPNNNIRKLLETREHENILQFIPHPDEPFKYYSPYMELCIHDIIFTKSFLYPQGDTSKAYLVFQIIKGLMWLHDKNIFHAYLNPHDIYLENYYRAKIGGFYFSEIFKDKNDFSVKENRALYYRPTNEEKCHLGLKYDIWCLGLLIFEFIFRQDASEFIEKNLNEYWNENVPKPDQDVFDFYKKFLLLNYKERVWLNEINLKITTSLSYFMNKEFDQYKNDYSFQTINSLTFILTHHFTGGKVCLKIRNLKNQVNDFQRELLIYKNRDVQHERFAAAYIHDIPCSNQSQPYIWLLTEYAQHGSLKDSIMNLKRGKKTFSDHDLKYYTQQMLQLLVYMHEKNIVHRNIKPSNLLLFERNNKITVKLTDFYCAKSDMAKLGTNLTMVNLTEYTAPEVYDDKKFYGKSADVWSVGCVIYEMVYFRKAFNGKGKPDHLPGDLDKISQPNIKEICQKIIVLDHENRLTSSDLKELFDRFI